MHRNNIPSICNPPQLTILLNGLKKWKQSTQHHYITEQNASLTLWNFIFPCRLPCHLPCKFEEDVWIVWTYLKSKQRQIPIQLVQLLLEQQQSLRWQLHTPHTPKTLANTHTGGSAPTHTPLCWVSTRRKKVESFSLKGVTLGCFVLADSTKGV